MNSQQDATFGMAHPPALTADGVPSGRPRQTKLTMALALAGLIGGAAASGAHAQTQTQPSAKAAAPQAVPQAKRQPTAKAPASKSEAADADGDSAAGKASPARKRDPAEAQRLVDAGTKQLQAGRTEQAIQTFSAAIAGGNLPPPVMAKALHQRGAAYRLAKKPAQAISDLTSALWLKGGLNDADRSDAIAQRASAYREAGLPDQADENGRVAGGSPPTRSSRSASTESTAAVPAGPTTSLAAADGPAAPANPVGNLFANLFGGPKAAPAPVSDADAPARPARTSRTEAATSGWASTVTAPPTAPPPGTARIATASAATAAVPTARPAPVAAPASAPASAAPAGRFHARIGTFRSEADATSAGTRLRTQHAAIVGSRQPQVATLQFGGNTLYHVRLGPFATAAEAAAVCAQVKSGDMDCTPVDR